MRLIVDAHLDLAWNALSLNRDITLPLESVRAAEAGLTDDSSRGRSMVTLPEMRRGGVGLCIGTLLARCGPSTPAKPPLSRDALDYTSPAAAHAVARGQLAYYEALERAGEIRIIRTRQELKGHRVVWSSGSPPLEGRGQGRVESEKGVEPEKKVESHFQNKDSRSLYSGLPIGLILGMECADPILDIADLHRWHAAGLRSIELAHYGHARYAGGTATETGLTPAGVELLREMEKLGLILDVTHLSDPSLDEALDIFGGTVIASHHNCRALCDGQRQLPDRQIRRIVERGGVIGLALYNPMLQTGWKYGQTPRESITLGRVADHYDHICQLAGNTNHTAIGSDFDGGFGYEATPTGLDSIADLPKLAAVLSGRGYNETDLNNFFHANWLQVMERALPV